jgi:hypothetical protein
LVILRENLILMEENTDFNFWEEVNNDTVYDKLFPQSAEGRIILYLFDKFKSSSFSPSDLENAIKTVKPQNIRDIQGNLTNKFHKYFISRNRPNDTYSLREHALRFGELAYSTLDAHSKPAKIEKLCKNLRRDLEHYIEIEDFNYWQERIFDKNKHEFHQQIDVLDEKLNQLIFELQLKSEKDGDFLNLLQIMIDKLSDIEGEYQKLSTAFAETENIKDILSKYLQDYSLTDDLKEQVRNSIDFFSNTEQKLDNVNIRINKIQPVIHYRVSIFGRSNFASKINRFVDYLLDKSILKNQKIELPSGIKRIPLTSNQVVFEALKQFSRPLKIIPRQINKPSSSERKEAFLEEDFKIEIQRKAIKLLRELNNDLLTNKEIFISKYYAKIIDEQIGSFSLITLFTYLVIREYDNSKNWELEITSESIQYQKAKNIIELWEIRIFQKSLGI